MSGFEPPRSSVEHTRESDDRSSSGGGGEPTTYLDAAFEQDWAQTIKTFGFLPTSSIHFCVMCNDVEDHRILGELALCFVRVYGGVIDFCGPLIPASTLSDQERANMARLLCDSNWPDIAPPRERFFARLPGRLVAIPYETANGRRWAVHVGDPDFMAAWLSHPDFRFIK